MRTYRILAHITAIIHLIIIFGNMLAIPFLIAKMPFYVWLPMITLLVSPVIGGSYCMFNQLENHFRSKAGMKLIVDRLSHLLRQE